MNPINLIQNYRENYSVMNVPRNLKQSIYTFNDKRQITDEEFIVVLKYRIRQSKKEIKKLKEAYKRSEV